MTFARIFGTPENQVLVHLANADRPVVLITWGEHGQNAFPMPFPNTEKGWAAAHTALDRMTDEHVRPFTVLREAIENAETPDPFAGTPQP